MASKKQDSGQQDNKGGGFSFEEILRAVQSSAASGGSYVPGQVSPSTRSAIGVKGTQVIDPTTGKPTGYFGYTTQEMLPRTSGWEPGGQVVTNNPRYFSGDEDTINSFSKEDIAVVQAQMKSNGFLSGVYTPGIVDNKTRAGFRNLLGVANRMGSDWQTALGSVSQARKEAGIQAGGLRTYTVDNPEDLKAVFRKAAQDMLGRNLQDGDLNALVQSFQQQQAQYQRQAQTVGGVVTQAPSAQAFAESQIQKDFGKEVDTRKIDRLFSVFDKVAGSK